MSLLDDLHPPTKYVFYDVIDKDILWKPYKYILEQVEYKDHWGNKQYKFKLRKEEIQLNNDFTWTIDPHGDHYGVVISKGSVSYTFPRNPQSQFAWVHALVARDIALHYPDYVPVLLIPYNIEIIHPTANYTELMTWMYELDFWRCMYISSDGVMFGNKYSLTFMENSKQQVRVRTFNTHEDWFNVLTGYIDPDKVTDFLKNTDVQIPGWSRFGLGGWVTKVPYIVQQWNYWRCDQSDKSNATDPIDCQYIDWPLTFQERQGHDITPAHLYIHPINVSKILTIVDEKSTKYTAETTNEQMMNIYNMLINSVFQKMMEVITLLFSVYIDNNVFVCDTPYKPLFDMFDVANMFDDKYVQGENVFDDKPTEPPKLDNMDSWQYRSKDLNVLLNPVHTYKRRENGVEKEYHNDLTYRNQYHNFDPTVVFEPHRLINRFSSTGFTYGNPYKPDTHLYDTNREIKTDTRLSKYVQRWQDEKKRVYIPQELVQQSNKLSNKLTNKLVSKQEIAN